MMNRNFFATLLCLAASQILSASVVTNISTGQAAVDPIWTITAGGSGPAQVVTTPIWGAIAPAGSAWVSTTTGNILPTGAAYSLQTTFTTNSPTATLEYRALGDNWLSVYIDNAATPAFPPLPRYVGEPL